MSDRTWVEIDLGALGANARIFAERVRPARLLPMVKADAYGLGVIAVVRALEPLDPWGYGVATADEGRQLREAGIARRILVWQPTLGMLPACAAHHLTPALGSAEELGAWVGIAGSTPFHFQVDTGMNRGGVWWESLTGAAAGFAAAPGFEGLCTHFHSAERDAASVRSQWGRFQAVLEALPRRPALVHAANSAAALTCPETVGDLVRPGIFLYGGAAGPHRTTPVLSWRTRVSRVRWCEPGETVGYGAQWRAAERTCVSTLAVGYADGVRRTLSGRGEVLIGGKRHRMVGVVSMDYTTVASPAPQPEPDDAATLIGRDGDEALTLEDVAEAAGTISYEILTGIGGRVERVYR